MLSLPNGFPDQNGMFNQNPVSFHRQPGSPGSENLFASGGHHDPPDQSFNSAHDQDFDFPFFASGTQSFELDHNFMDPGTSQMVYTSQAAGSRFASQPDLLSMPSGVTSDHEFPSHYSSIYESNSTTNPSQYISGLALLQGVNNALSLQSRSYTPHWSSPWDSDSSFEEAWSGYSSSSNTSRRSAMVSLPPHSETEKYLRRSLDIPPHLPVDLSVLPETTERKQPPITHMIKLAIWGSDDKMLTLRGIYREIENRYPSLKDLRDKPWQRSIRHNLSLKAIFVRLERPPNAPGSGHYWAIDFRNGEGNKRDRKRNAGSRGSSSRSRSDEEDDLSEEVDEDRPSAVGRQLQVEHKAIHVSRTQLDQYVAVGPSMYPQASMPTSRMGYQSAMPPPRIGQPSPQSHPLQMGATSSGPPNEFSAYTRGMLPANTGPNTLYRTAPYGHGPMMDVSGQPFGNYMQEQMSMVNMDPSMLGQMPMLDHYGQGIGSRRPAPDEGDDARENRPRRTAE